MESHRGNPYVALHTSKHLLELEYFKPLTLKQKTEWNESEIGGYETDSKYFGTSIGIGHIYSIGKNGLDIYTRYTYGHTGSCDATVGDKEYKFDIVKSSRLRFGPKLNIIVKGKVCIVIIRFSFYRFYL